MSKTVDGQLSFSAVYACVTLIANDFGSLRPRLVEKRGNVWKETTSASFSPVIRKPNRYQNHIQFKQWWATSKLTFGNTYVLLVRDNRGVVVEQYILDARRVYPLVAPDGQVYYTLHTDNLSGVQGEITVPASEIIHDRMNCLFHPLVGIPPLYAAGSPAAQGLAIQNQSRNFFVNGARPSGVLTAPGAISQETADRLKSHWEEKFTGENSGKVAVLGDGLQYSPMTMTYVDAQLIEQMKMTIEAICTAFHVPPFKIGHGQMPTFQNGETLNQIYYSDCLQSLIEEYELCQDEGLGIGEAITVNGRKTQLGIDLDLRGLLRMDKATQVRTLGEAVKGSIMTVNEAREEIDLDKVSGGDTVYMQQQNFGLDALAKRDSLPNPFVIDRPTANPDPSVSGPAVNADPTQAVDQVAAAKAFAYDAQKAFEQELIA
jgi:HK97 family phage portal protein